MRSKLDRSESSTRRDASSLISDTKSFTFVMKMKNFDRDMLSFRIQTLLAGEQPAQRSWAGPEFQSYDWNPRKFAGVTSLSASVSVSAFKSAAFVLASQPKAGKEAEMETVAVCLLTWPVYGEVAFRVCETFI